MRKTTNWSLVLLWASKHLDTFRLWVDRNRQKLIDVVWEFGRIVIWSEVLVGLVIFGWKGGMAWFMFAMSSLSEGYSNKQIINFQIFKKRSEAKKDSHEEHHARLSVEAKTVNRRLASIFVFLALSGPLITTIFGEINPNDNIFTMIIAITFLALAGLLGLLKWLLSEQHQSARHDAKQTLICALSSIFVLLTVWVQPIWSMFDLVSELAISGLLLWTAYKALKSPEPICH